MPWLDNDTPTTVSNSRVNKNVSLWPEHETTRIDARFRMIRSNPEPFPRAVRHLVRIKPLIGAGTTIFNGWLNVTIDTVDRFVGSTGLGPDGYDLQLEIDQYDVAVHPVWGDHGVEFVWTYSHVGFPNFFSAWWYPSDGAAPILNFTPAQIQPFTPVGGWPTFRTDYDPLVNTDWTDTNMHRSWEWWSLSECWVFPAVPVAGFAEFNGTTAYIKNRSRTNDTTGAWRQEFDIRLQATDNCDYFCKSFNTTRFCRIGPNDIGWIGRFVTFTTPLVVGTWYHIDFRYQWDSADGLYRVAVDGGADDTSANTNFNAKLDQYGRRGSQVPRGEFDLKNFLFRDGTAASNTVYLDQNMDVNACDAGPDARDGDTFFMPLPSCP